MPCINAVSFHENPSIESICRTVRAMGFDTLELSRPPFYYKLITSGTRGRFAEWAGQLGLALYGFDCWVDVLPYDRFDATLADFEAAVEWAEDLNLGFIISHDPWARDNSTRKRATCLKKNIELFRRVLEMTRRLTLVLEPHPDTLSMDDAWAMDLIDGIAEGHPPGRVGILYDCCHYGVGQPKGYLQAIERLGRRIRHVHMSDGDAQTYALHLPLGDGTLDLDGIVAALKQTGFNGTLTNDMYNYPLLEDGGRRNLDKIRAIEQELGIKRTMPL